MIVNSDGTFSLDKGERIPYICPRCNLPIQYEENLLMVRCARCGLLDEVSKFTGNVFMKDNKPPNE